jgi:hypothetical protein
MFQLPLVGVQGQKIDVQTLELSGPILSVATSYTKQYMN